MLIPLETNFIIAYFYLIVKEKTYLKEDKNDVWFHRENFKMACDKFQEITILRKKKRSVLQNGQNVIRSYKT
jgi:hypothetical protein